LSDAAETDAAETDAAVTDAAVTDAAVTDLAVIRAHDLAVCKDMLQVGSKSFSAAALLLPGWMRAPVAGLYAFCRMADDIIDEGGTAAGLAELKTRLDLIYAQTPQDHPVDRAFSHVVRDYDIPRPVTDLLLEGFAWDLDGRHYATLSDTIAYGVRVASTVGVMMTLIMGPRDRATLARAADLGVAMQLTNIARDVGEDARNGRVYLPADWLAEAGVTPEQLGEDPQFTPGVGVVTRRLLEEADRLYLRSRTGIGRLPYRCRLAIRGASLIYRDIGRVIAGRGYNSVDTRAYTGRLRKVWLLSRALGTALYTPKMPTSSGGEPELDEVAPLLDPITG
jgi:phytoene synthase